jgi:hypothetical protein
MNETEGCSMCKLMLLPFLTTLIGANFGSYYGVNIILSSFVGWAIGVAALLLPFLFAMWFPRHPRQ